MFKPLIRGRQFLGIFSHQLIPVIIQGPVATFNTQQFDRLVVGLGGRANTAYGLAGLGALTTQLFAAQGDAIEAGAALARGETEAARAHGELVEAARTLSERAAAQRLRAPMVDAVNGLFEGRLGAAEALAALMSRAVRSERG